MVGLDKPFGPNLGFKFDMRERSFVRPKGANDRFGGVGRGRAVIGDELNYSTTITISQAYPSAAQECKWPVWRGWEG